MSELFDDPFIDFSDPFNADLAHENEFGQQIKRCVHCGVSGLHWEDFGSGWKLYDEHDDRHLCQAVEPSADDFDVLT